MEITNSNGTVSSKNKKKHQQLERQKCHKLRVVNPPTTSAARFKYYVKCVQGQQPDLTDQQTYKYEIIKFIQFGCRQCRQHHREVDVFVAFVVLS